MLRIGCEPLILAVILFGASCSTTQQDDSGNFKRIFGFDKPKDIEVVHSRYWEARTWRGMVHRYYIVTREPEKKVKKLVESMSNDPGFIPNANPDFNARKACGEDPPSWFAPKAPENYDLWTAKNETGVRIFRDKGDNTIHSCAGRT